MQTSINNRMTQTAESQSLMTPEMVIKWLKEGNARFVENKRLDRNLITQVANTGGGQYPFAVVLGCIDSRVPAELIFDQGIGDIFNIRIAGNFVNTDILGSMEFACKVAGSKAILVLGHTHCGAVKGACDQVELGNLTDMLANIKPAVDSVNESGDRSSKNPQFVQQVAEANVKLTIDNIREKSVILKEMEANGEITIVGGIYDVETGNVELL